MSPSLTQPLTPNNEASTLPDYGIADLLPSLLHRLTIEPLLPVYGRIYSQLSPLTWICSCYGVFSQCIKIEHPPNENSLLNPIHIKIESKRCDVDLINLLTFPLK